ncbi:hypothetical protein [Brucella sp. JSBI001]|uniref:hypothetical protein n=1 Tax=Brucella sp. JSBI001 TaxID=2886044 RepID=UPI00222ED19B|nr:hypothetical protein [Brucella sp. JSBI001]UZD70895.1 hypothetical protein LJ361_05615 [Brucella sp. JSBI001]
MASKTQTKEFVQLKAALFETALCVTNINGVLMPLLYGDKLDLKVDPIIKARQDYGVLQTNIQKLIKSLQALERGTSDDVE